MTTTRITHIGGPTALLEVEGWQLLTDPTFDPPRAAGTASAGRQLPKADRPGDRRRRPRPNRRRAGRSRPPRRQPRHHRPGPAPGGRRRPHHNRRRSATRRQRPRPGPWATTQLEAPAKPPIQVTATPCRHGPPLSRPIAGEVIGFALGWESQEHGTLWITGDTVLYDGVRRIADRLQVDTAILHLGCVRFPITGPIRYTMTAQEAVELCRLVRPRTAIPVHYEGWTHFHQDRAAIEQQFAQAPADIGRRLQWLPIGVGISIAA